MRILLFSDLHLERPFRWATTTLGAERRHALRKTLSNIIELAAELKVDALACGGDLYEHEYFSPDTIAFLADEFGKVNAPVLLAPGNHDWLGPAAVYSLARWSSNVHVFTRDRLEAYELTDGFTVWGAAHRAPAGTRSFLDHFSTERGGINVGLFHGSETSGFAAQGEGKHAHAPFHEYEIAAAGLAHVMLGHYHNPVQATTYTYPGNPEPLNFGETGERGAVLLEFAPDGSVTRTVHEVAETDVRDIEIDLTGVTDGTAIRERIATVLSDASGVVRATLIGEIPPDAEFDVRGLRGAAPHLGDGLVLREGMLRRAYDLKTISSEQTVRGQFVRDVLASDFDEETSTLVLTVGLRALDGRTDLAVL